MSEVKIWQWPWRLIGWNYLLTFLVVNALVHTHSLLTIPYCDWSFYDGKRTSKDLLKLIHEENAKAKQTIDGKAHQPIEFKPKS